MSPAEKFTLAGLLAHLKPEVAIEIGTQHGGSLQVLAAHSGQVHSIDLNPDVGPRLAPRFPSVRFHAGRSQVVLPNVLREIDAAGRGKLGFILIDGDHSTAGVRGDIAALLSYRPRATVHVLVHDSFNPACRSGMSQADWSAGAHVHAVDLDFVPGTYHAGVPGGTFDRSMWGGFALAVLKPEPRTGPLIIGRSQEELHQFMFRHSGHRLWPKAVRFMRRCFGG